MLGALLFILMILWFFGFIHIPGLVIPRNPIFFLNRHPITVWDIVIFVIVLWVIDLLPTPIREIAGILLLLWVLSVIGIIALGGLSHVLLLAIIIGVAIALFH